jgi:pilus assembly protein Flp/PilA
MLHTIMKFLRDEEGASAVEYGLIIGLIAVALVIVLGLLGGGLETLFQAASDEVTGAAPATPPP